MAGWTASRPVRPVSAAERLTGQTEMNETSAFKIGLLARCDELEQDAARRARAEAELRESEEIHRITLGSISDAVFITDDAGRFTFICPNVDVIFGYSYEEVRAFGNIARLLGEDPFDLEELEESGEVDLGEAGELSVFRCEGEARQRHLGQLLGLDRAVREVRLRLRP